jgi:uncharacterized membrane protein YdbT with pleckstrin-like domain
VRPDERVLRRDGAARGYAVLLYLLGAAPVLLLAAGALVADLLLPRVSFPLWAVVGAAALLLALVALVAWRRQATSEYVLTDERVYARTGRLVTQVHFATHDKVTDLRYRQGPLERILGVSSLTFATAGGEVRVAGVADALAVKEAAERARDAFVQRLLERAGVPAPQGTDAAPAGLPTAEAPAAPAPLPLPAWTGPRPDYVKAGDVPAWSAKPVLLAALGSLQPFLGVFALVLFTQLTRNPYAPWLLAALVAAALAMLAFRALQLRRAEYLATDRRVYARSGLLGTTVRQLTYDKITDITYRQDVLGRLLGYGTVSLTTAGGAGGAVHLHGLRTPLQAKEAIEALRGRYLREADA